MRLAAVGDVTGVPSRTRVFTETIDALREQGFAVIGAGRDIAQARRPAVRRPGCGESHYRRCLKSTLTWNSLAVRKRSL